MSVSLRSLGAACLLMAGLSACSNRDKPALMRRLTGEKMLDTAAFGEVLQEVLPEASDTAQTKLLPVEAGVRLAYERRGYAPLWLDARGTPDTAALFADLRGLAADGLSPDSYGLADLQRTASRLKADDAIGTLVAWDTACTHAYLKASRDLLLGVLAPRRADSLWFHANDSLWTAPEQLAAAGGQYLSLDSFRSAIPAYAALRTAHRQLEELTANEAIRSAKAAVGETVPVPDSLVRAIVSAEVPDWKSYQPDSLDGLSGMVGAYQAYYGQRVSGKVDSTTASLLARPVDSVAKLVRANLERLRWLPRTFEESYVEVNIPMMELRYNNCSAEDFRMRVVVGRPSRQTPALGALMANVVFNPGWGVPPTILKKDVLPGVSRSGAAYLAKKGLHAYDRNGNEVSAGRINPSNYRSYTFRQPPGPRNALGEVKFNLPNRWDIYLHDTPHREDFPKRNRALSSGCVRVQKPKEFAEFILADLEGRERFTPDRIDSIIATRKTRYEILQRKIPVHIVYLTADADRGAVRFFDDIYKRDRKLMALLPH